MLKKSFKPMTALLAASLLSLPLVSCDRDTPAENAGEAVEEAADEVGDAVEDAKD